MLLGVKHRHTAMAIAVSQQGRVVWRGTCATCGQITPPQDSKDLAYYYAPGGGYAERIQRLRAKRSPLAYIG